MLATWRRVPLELRSNIAGIAIGAIATLAAAYRIDDLTLLGLSLIPLLVGVLFLMRYMSSLRSAPFAGEMFLGLRIGRREQIWRRRDLTFEAVRHIAGAAPVTVFSGESGAGKTSLFRFEIAPVLEREGWTVRFIEDYTQLDDAVMDTLDDLPRPPRFGKWLARLAGPRRVVVVFDQAEQLTYRSRDQMQWFTRALRRAVNDGLRVAFVVRKDFFYDLRFLGGLLPHVTDVFEVPGMSIERGSADYRGIAGAMSSVATPRLMERILGELAQLRGDGRVVPLHVQLAGAVLEEHAERRGGIVDVGDAAAFGASAAGMFRAFFGSHVDGAPDPDAARLVLFALSVPRRLRSPMTAAEIVRATYLGREVVRDALRYLVTQRLLSPAGSMFQWTHDALPGLYRDYASGTILAGLRAVITDRVETPQPAVPAQRLVRPAEETARETRAATVFLVLLLTIIVARVIWAAATGETFDGDSYFIVWPAHMGWAWFVYNLNRHLFIRVGRSARLYPWPVLGVIGLGAIAASCWRPALWVASMGIVGVAIGANLAWMQRRVPASEPNRRQFGSVGATFLWMGFLMLAGGTLMAFTLVPAFRGAREFALISFGASILMGRISFTASAKYAGRNEAAVWLGLLDHSSVNLSLAVRNDCPPELRRQRRTP